jgi:very-short-patch-repair endonuclease
MGTSGDIRRVGALAAARRGVVTRAQLRGIGLSPHVIHRLLAQGHLHRIHAQVFAVGHRALTLEGRWLAATLALGPDAVLSHRAAAALWSILPRTQPLEVTVPTTSGCRHRDGMRVHRRRLVPNDRVVRDGIPVTSLTRTFLDLAAGLDARTLAQAFEEAQILHRLRPATLAAELVAQPGRRGAGKLRTVLDGAVEPGQAESVLELRFLKLCSDHGLPRPLTQVRIGPWRADFFFPEQRVVVETDGGRYHATAAKQSRDGRKAAAFEAAGLTVRRLTYAAVTYEPTETAKGLRIALR